MAFTEQFDVVVVTKAGTMSCVEAARVMMNGYA
jgi:hypothetical protein